MFLTHANAKALPMPQVVDLQSNPGTRHEQVKSKHHKSSSTTAPDVKHPVHDTDYSEKSSDRKADKEKTAEKPTAKAKGTKKKSAPKQVSTSGAADVDDNAVPNPAPDVAPPKNSVTVYHSGAVYSGVLPVVPPTPTSIHTVPTSGFSPLPLAAFATSLSAVTASGTSSLSLASATPSAIQKTQHTNTASAAKPLPTVSIVLLAIGGFFLILGLVIFGRVCCRPRKHKYPTPSRPVLQDPFQDDEKADADEESLFGGKERSSSSAQPGSGEVLLNWTKYPHTSLMKPLPVLDIGSSQESPTRRASPQQVQKACSPFLGVPPTPGSHFGTRSPSRVSVISASVYPGSPMSTMAGPGVGIAVGGSPLTADNLPLLQRSNTKNSMRRASQAGRTNRHSVIPSTYGTSDLYGGVASPVPATPKPAATSNAAGRARVKAPYAPGSFLRASATAPVAAASLIEETNPFEESQYILPPISPMTKTEDRRERDTKALASALGLSSPIPVPPSPQTTLYPDDSITLAGDRRRSRSRSVIMSPPLDATARLGKLMMGEFQSTNSLTSGRNIGDGGHSRVQVKSTPRKRVEEKPPRVPSPPPMPSLAQMAMSHGNPQAFEDYRSPTYSIYGLYEAERKSKLPGEGGY